MAGVQIATRIDPVIKEKAASVFAHYGLDISTAVKMFITTAANENRVPLEVSEPIPTLSARALGKVRKGARRINLSYDKESKALIVPNDAPEDFKDWVKNG